VRAETDDKILPAKLVNREVGSRSDPVISDDGTGDAREMAWYQEVRRGKSRMNPAAISATPTKRTAEVLPVSGTADVKALFSPSAAKCRQGTAAGADVFMPKHPAEDTVCTDYDW
jgi:hypothetical protein